MFSLCLSNDPAISSQKRRSWPPSGGGTRRGASDGSCIQTVAARGYRLVARVTRVEHVATPTLADATQEDTSATRRLMAILAADVAGYSRLMGEDEEGTLIRLKAHRRELVDP